MNSVNTKIKFISAADALDLRTRILRPQQPIENCIYDGDLQPSTFHLGVVTTNSKIICNATFMQESHPRFLNAALAYRLRGMATESSYQKQGYGKSLLEVALMELKKRKCDLLWFNARVSAEGFYQKLGFISLNDIFDIAGAGPHKVMYKNSF